MGDHFAEVQVTEGPITHTAKPVVDMSVLNKARPIWRGVGGIGGGDVACVAGGHASPLFQVLAPWLRTAKILQSQGLCAIELIGMGSEAWNYGPKFAAFCTGGVLGINQAFDLNAESAGGYP